jgi:hypothetical protein
VLHPCREGNHHAQGLSAGQALKLTGGVKRIAEERFLLEFDENIAVLSELVEEGMEQKDKQKRSPPFLESLSEDRNTHLYRAHSWRRTRSYCSQ